MGMFMQSVSFRRPADRDWVSLAPRIRALLESYGENPELVGLEAEKDYFCVLSPYGDMGTAVELLAQGISAITGDYAIAAQCVDSDFNMLTLYHGGETVDAGSSGNLYEEFAELGAGGELHPALWQPLLKDPTQTAELEQALLGEALYAEELLRKLTELTGFPVFDFSDLAAWEEADF